MFTVDKDLTIKELFSFEEMIDIFDNKNKFISILKSIMIDAYELKWEDIKKIKYNIYKDNELASIKCYPYKLLVKKEELIISDVKYIKYLIDDIDIRYDRDNLARIKDFLNNKIPETKTYKYNQNKYLILPV
ncbi:MAG: hypothetical protein QXF12_08215 [Candidatus Aenigmatarchaeota archaeon]